MRVTEDELVLAAHYGFGSRLTDVVAAALTYQRDKRAFDRLDADAADSREVLATAHRLRDRLPSHLRLLELAEEQEARSRRELARGAERMRVSADVFVETLGGAAGDVVAAMEAHDWALDRPKLLAALRRQAGLGAGR